ncbi:MAG TPA: hypothetical protein PLZ95_00895 [Bryobacteraceae bacterium]|nr:hypothetical protein [Bryobacteraceae bacterium]
MEMTFPMGVPVMQFAYHLDAAFCPSSTPGRCSHAWKVKVEANEETVFIRSGAFEIGQSSAPGPGWFCSSEWCEFYEQSEINLYPFNRTAPAAVKLQVEMTQLGNMGTAHNYAAALGLPLVGSLTRDPLPSGFSLGDGSYYSIPPQGGTNTFQRANSASVLQVPNWTIQRGKTTVLDGDVALGVSVDAPLGTDDAARVRWRGTSTEINTYRDLGVRITFSPLASAISTAPPPAAEIQHQISVTAADAEGRAVLGKATSENRHPLYLMPASMSDRRFGPRDRGGDNWCTRQTYLWIHNNSNLLTRINDISGEHARNIGHRSHFTGNMFDIYHFYTVPGAIPTSAGSNLQQLRRETAKALAGIVGSAQTVRDWVQAERTGLAALLQNTDVVRIYTAYGASGQAISVVKPDGSTVSITLPVGWQHDLLRTGQVSELDLGVGAWTNASSPKLRFDDHFIHDDHHHVTLRQ